MDIVIYVMAGMLLITGILILIYRVKILNPGQRLQVQVDTVIEQLDRKQNNILTGTRFYIDRNLYNGMRVVGGAFLCGYGLLSHIIWPITLAFAFYLLTNPVSSLKGIRTPFFYFNQIFCQYEKKKADGELLEMIGFLKNLATLQSRNSVGAEYIISELASVAEFTKPAFLMMLNKLRVNRKAEACEAFSSVVNTEMGRDLAHLLIELDELKPRELQEVILMRQRQAQSIRSTRLRRSDETISVLVFLPVVAAIMVVFLNFIVLIQMKIGYGVFQ